VGAASHETHDVAGQSRLGLTYRSRPGDIPPCIRQRPFGIAADRQGLPFLVRAPDHRLPAGMHIDALLATADEVIE
jgi:hypothetical protein